MNSLNLKKERMTRSLEKYFYHLKSVCPELTDVELEQFSKGLTVSKFDKNNFYITSGNIQSQGGFIVEGLIRAFHTDDLGNEKNIYFKSENEYAFHYASFMLKNPSPLSFQCLEPSIIVNLPIDHIHKAYKEIPKFEKYGRLVTEQRVNNQQERLESLLYQNSEQRYINFTNQYPQLLNRITISQLCSYLGVERQTLTRIRKKLTSQK
jgi:CRP-like cAMP-binding protein